MDRILDAARSGPTFLKIPEVAEVMVSAINEGQRLNRYELHAWVVMANHVHVLVTPQVPSSEWLRLLKGSSARYANQLLRRQGPFWQDESYDHLVRSADEFRRIEAYIENDPVKAGLVGAPEQFLWSSARAG